LVLDPPHAVTTAATRKKAAQNQIFFMVSPYPGVKPFPHMRE
jgi:hypothetical protein